jgi:serine/threonine-protein kinase HipA
LASIAKLVEALRALPVRGADLLQLQRWVMFNYLIGNADAHAKNISVLVDDKGYRLSPMYDLLCVKAYGDEGLALYIGDENTFDAVGAHSWEALCKDCGFRLPETLKGFRKLAQDLLPAWHKVLARLQQDTQPTEAERALLERMTQIFEAHTKNALSMTEGGGNGK